jgi:hypothetical protein
MQVLKGDSGTIYHGHQNDNGYSMISIEDASGTQVGVVQHLPKHSPTGMNWGYRGAGPADTERSLLIAVLEDGALCGVCQGTGRVVYVRRDDDLAAERYDPAGHFWARQGWQCECDGGYRRLPYLAFAEELVTSWGAEWRISRATICAWLEGNLAN